MNRRYNRLYISNISTSGSLDDLKELLEKCGKVVLFEIENGKGKLFNLGYVEFETSQHA